MIVGLVLAGGRSSRFGSEKAMAPLEDGVMIEAPIRALFDVCPQVAVSARLDSGAASHAASLGLSVLQDGPADAQGPLAGIRRGLIWAVGQGAQRLAVAPCDAPTLTGAHYRRLVSETGAAVARSTGGIEPLVSIWPVSSLAAIQSALADGAHPPIHALLAEIGAIEVMLPDYDGANVNRPADLTP